MLFTVIYLLADWWSHYLQGSFKGTNNPPSAFSGMLTILIKQNGRSCWKKSALKVHIMFLFVCSAFKTFWTLQSLCAEVLLLSFYSFSTFCGQEHSREWGSGSASVPGENAALPGMPCCQGTEAFNSFSCAEMAASFNPCIWKGVTDVVPSLFHQMWTAETFVLNVSPLLF